MTVARKWAQTHCQDKGTCASFTAGGQRTASYVEIVKKIEGFDVLEMTPYRLRIEEYTMLMAFLPSSGPHTAEATHSTDDENGEPTEVTLEVDSSTLCLLQQQCLSDSYLWPG